MDENLIAGIF